MKDRIKQLMDDQHLTQQSFAQLIGSTPATLSNIFNGKDQSVTQYCGWDS